MCAMCSRQHSSLLLCLFSRSPNKVNSKNWSAHHHGIREKCKKRIVPFARVLTAAAAEKCTGDAVDIWSNQLPYLWTRTKLWWCITFADAGHQLILISIFAIGLLIAFGTMSFSLTNREAHLNFQESIARNSMQNNDECEMPCCINRHQHHDRRPVCMCEYARKSQSNAQKKREREILTNLSIA